MQIISVTHTGLVQARVTAAEQDVARISKG